METGQRKKDTNKAPSTINGLGFQRPKILIARQRQPHAIGGFGFKGAQVLLARTDGKEVGNGFKTDVERQLPGEGRLVREIKTIVERMLSEGKNLKEIVDEAGLSKVERRAFYVYVWRENRITQDEAAKRLGKKKVTLTHAVKRIANKLLGIDAYYHLIKEYASLSNQELEERIRKLGAKSKVEIDRKNSGLYKVARERGVLDKLFPPPWVKKLRDALDTALQERKLEGIMSDSTDLERDLINEVVLCEVPPSIRAFAKKQGLKPDKVSRRMKRLADKLNGVPITFDDSDNSTLLRKSIEGLDEDRLAELKSVLDEKELAILERRVLSERQESLHKIGKSCSVTRQRMSQIEARMLDKIESWKKGETLDKKMRGRKGKRAANIKRMVEERVSKGETVKGIKKDAGLNGFESQVLHRYVLSKKRISQRETAEKLGKAEKAVSAALERIENKLLGKHVFRECKGVRRIKVIMERLLLQGRSLHEIIEEAGLSLVENQVLDIYVLSKNHIKQKDAAKILGIPTGSLNNKLIDIRTKLARLEKRGF